MARGYGNRLSSPQRRGTTWLPSRSLTDAGLLPQLGRVVLVMLKDGRQLEGELVTLTGRYQVGGEVFEAWEIDELEDLA